MMEGSHDNQEYIRVRLSPVQYITKEEEEKIILQQVDICMSFTMKMLVVSVLVLAMMALTSGAEAEATNSTEPPPTEKEVEPESTLDKEAAEPDSGSDEDDTDDDTDDDKDSTTDDGKHKIAKRATRCPCGWALYRGRCFRYFARATTWAIAQRHCQNMGGNLASVHNAYEENWMRRFVRYRQTWLGFSDAQQSNYWFWIDGTRFTYSHWCRGQPSDRRGRQNCLQINWTSRKCWDDLSCLARRGYVCARR